MQDSLPTTTSLSVTHRQEYGSKGLVQAESKGIRITKVKLSEPINPEYPYKVITPTIEEYLQMFNMTIADDHVMISFPSEPALLPKSGIIINEGEKNSERKKQGNSGFTVIKVGNLEQKNVLTNEVVPGKKVALRSYAMADPASLNFFTVFNAYIHEYPYEKNTLIAEGGFKYSIAIVHISDIIAVLNF